MLGFVDYLGKSEKLFDTSVLKWFSVFKQEVTDVIRQDVVSLKIEKIKYQCLLQIIFFYC